MSQQTDVRDVVARKCHRCSWCGEDILSGETYPQYSIFAEGTAQRMRMHRECYQALKVVISDQGGGWYEWTQGDHVRGRPYQEMET